MGDNPFRTAILEAFNGEGEEAVIVSDALHWEIGDVYAFSSSELLFTLLLQDEDDDRYESAFVRADLTTSPPTFTVTPFPDHSINVLPRSFDDVYLHTGPRLFRFEAGEIAEHHECPAYWAGYGPVETDDGMVIWGTDGVFRFDGKAFEALPFDGLSSRGTDDADDDDVGVDVRGVSWSSRGLLACGANGGLYRLEDGTFRRAESQTHEFLTAAVDLEDGSTLLAGDEGFVAVLRGDQLSRFEVDSESESAWQVVEFDGSVYLSDGDDLYRRAGPVLEKVREFEGGAFVWATETRLTVSSYRELFIFDGEVWTRLRLGDDEGGFMCAVDTLDA